MKLSNFELIEAKGTSVLNKEFFAAEPEKD